MSQPLNCLQRLGLRRKTPWRPLTCLDVLVEMPFPSLATALYRLFLWLRQPGLPRGGASTATRLTSAASSRPIRVVCISDTHGRANFDVPDGDLLIHAGDLSSTGLAADLQRQIDWLDSLPHTYKICISGNHDEFFDARARFEQDRRPDVRLDLRSLLYLEHDEVTLDFFDGARSLRIFGAPDLPSTGLIGGAFVYDADASPWSTMNVPEGVDILVTHTPPFGHLDLGLGCVGLTRELWRVRPRLHVCGHIHAQHGQRTVYYDALQHAYERLAIAVRERAPAPPVVVEEKDKDLTGKSPLAVLRRWVHRWQRRFPILLLASPSLWLHTARMVAQGVQQVLFHWLMRADEDRRLLVNACVQSAVDRTVIQPPQVVLL